MVSVLVVDYSNENSKDLDVGDDLSSCCGIVVGGFEPTSPTLS
jgi:hypothetical protein